MPARRRRFAVLAASVLLAACGGRGPLPDAGAAASPVPPATAEAEPAPASGDRPAPSARPSPEPRPEATDAAGAAAVSANEFGQVPVVMSHRVLEDGGGDFDVTPEEFRAELARLYDDGYRPIRTVDLAPGDIDVPAGTTPVVLTFDDGSREQYALDEGGQVAARHRDRHPAGVRRGARGLRAGRVAVRER